MSTIQGTLVYEHGQALSLIVSVRETIRRTFLNRALWGQAIILFALISLLAIFGVLIRYSWDPLMAFARRRQGTNQHHSRAFFHTQLGAYIASLMLSNAFSSISMVINAQWAADKRVTNGASIQPCNKAPLS